MKTQIDKPKIVYAIYPNANGFGFVFMNGPRNLLDFGIVRINPICNFKLLEKIQDSISYFKPTVVILLDPDGKSSRTGKRTRKLLEKISAFAQSENLEVAHISRDQIRDVFENFGVITKFEIAQWLLTEFKELDTRRPKKRRLWTSEDRNQTLFDSLSLALTWYYLNS